MLYLLLSLASFSAFAQSTYPDSTLLSELPHGARLEVVGSPELGLAKDEQHQQMSHFCTWENGNCTPDEEVGFFFSIGAHYNTQLNLRTDVETSLIHKGGSIFSDGTYYLKPGIYCLDLPESKFRSTTDERKDKLRLTDCGGEKVFTIYARAGYHLRNRDGFRGYTVGEFHFQSGKALKWIR